MIKEIINVPSIIVTRTQLKTDIVLKNSACNVTGLDGTISMVIQKDIVTLKIQEGYHCL
jgi:hypothetical protein